MTLLNARLCHVDVNGLRLFHFQLSSSSLLTVLKHSFRFVQIRLITAIGLLRNTAVDIIRIYVHEGSYFIDTNFRRQTMVSIFMKKVKLSVCLISGGIDPSFLTSALDGDE
jgi:uncharacterized membrane protein YjgN (DUF898 family)